MDGIINHRRKKIKIETLIYVDLGLTYNSKYENISVN